MKKMQRLSVISAALVVSLLIPLCSVSADVAAKPPSDEYLITEKCVGSFVLGAEISTLSSGAGYEIKEETRDGGEGTVKTTYVVLENGEKTLEIEPAYPQIMIFSAEYHTKEEIRVGNTLEDLVKAYPKYALAYTYISDKFMFEAEGLPKTQFLLDGESFIGKQDLMEGDWIDLSLNDFKSSTKIISIRIYD